jgi:hypothetical protein
LENDLEVKSLVNAVGHRAGVLIGWAAARIILKQRLDHYKERMEYFKEPVPEAAKPNSNRQKKEMLQQLYLEGGVLLGK